MTMLCTLIRGQMSYTFFQLGGTCPPMAVAWGADVLICHFSVGGHMSGGGGNFLHSLRPSGWLASCWRARVRAGFDQYIIILNTLENRNFLSW